jgi:hypothetical protein
MCLQCAKLLHPVEGIMVPSSLLSADYGDAFVSMFSNINIWRLCCIFFLLHPSCVRKAWIQ